MQRVLITGGAGFIGSHLADELLAHGYRVRVFDALAAAAVDVGQSMYEIAHSHEGWGRIVAVGPRVKDWSEVA